jgi:hypothetical protein
VRSRQPEGDTLSGGSDRPGCRGGGGMGMYFDDPAFWRAGAIMLTIDSLSAISPGGSGDGRRREPPPLL